MSTSTKLEYLNETKQLIKKGINDIGGDITSQTTFRDYANVLNDIYEAFPKVTGSGTSITLNNTRKGKVSLELSPVALTQDSTPTPSSPQDIHTISGDNTIKVENKNLFDEVIEQGTFDPTTGNNQNDNNRIRTSYFSIKPNTTYTISTNSIIGALRVVYKQSDNTTIIAGEGISSNNKYASFTTPNNAYYMKISIGNSSYQFIATNDYQIMLEYGSSATTYTQHQESTQLISLGDIEYCKIGDYADEFYKASESDTTLESGKWYLKKNVPKLIFNGNENWAISNSGTPNWYYSYINSNNIPVSNSTSSNAMCNMYPIGSIGNSNTEQGIILIASNGQIRIRYGTEDTIENFKAWLSNNNVEFYYQALKPQYILLNNTLQEQLETSLIGFDGQTNISQANNDLQFSISASALKELE